MGWVGRGCAGGVERLRGISVSSGVRVRVCGGVGRLGQGEAHGRDARATGSESMG